MTRLDPADIDAIADLVVERLRAASPAAGWVDATTVAKHLGIKRSTVYEHAAQLGGQRAGEGRRGRWRFRLEEAETRWLHCSAGSRPAEPETPATEPSPPRRHRTRSARVPDLLPIRGREGAE